MKLPAPLTDKAFEDAVDAMVEERIREFQPPTSRVLFHYTDPTGFLGIVRDRLIYATDSRFMNDPRESRHAFDLLRAEADDVTNVAIEDLCKRDVLLKHSSYLTCLSELGDSLGQWRAYGADGLGFAVGLDTAAIPKTAAQVGDDAAVTTALPVLFRVIYDDAKKRRFLGDVKDLLTYSQTLGAPLQKTAFSGAQRLMSLFAMTFKHSAFAEEKEWRLTWLGGFMGNRQAWPRKFRATQRYGLAPYLEWNLQVDDVSPIREVRLGPRNRAETLGVCRTLLDEHRCAAQVYESAVPYH